MDTRQRQCKLMCGSRKFCQIDKGHSTFFFFFFFFFFFNDQGEGESKYHYKRAIIGPPPKRHLNGVSLECR